VNPDHPPWNASLLRRAFITRTGLGSVALASLLDPFCGNATLAGESAGGTESPGAGGAPHFPARAKRIIYLFQSGAPSQLDLFDPKPELSARFGEDLPDSIRKGQRLTGMTAAQTRFPVAPSRYRFSRYGRSGQWFSELLPHTAAIADRICVVRSLYTEAINHDPAITFLQTGAQIAGRPSIGAWAAYGLGSENRDLPAFVALVSNGSGNPNDQPLYDRLWGSGFLPSQYQGIKFRSGTDPVLFLSNPEGLDRAGRRRMLDDLGRLNRLQFGVQGDPETSTRISQYELAFRMQASVPELTDTRSEPASVRALYGPDVDRPGSFASNCLLARRLAERGVRFIQLFHRGWDQHTKLPAQLPGQCRDTDQPSAALVRDLEQRGLLEDTLVVWGGEFGRTVYCQGRLTPEDYGRDHHPRCFSIWLAGGGIRGGLAHGETDEFNYNIVRDPVHVHDLHATLLHCLGVDHTRLTYKFQGRHHRLTDVHGNPVTAILA
jgi:hypothetical protein